MQSKVVRQSAVRIPVEWFRLRPGKPMVYWVAVARVVRKRHIRKHDYVRVRQVTGELDLHLSHIRDIKIALEKCLNRRRN